MALGLLLPSLAQNPQGPARDKAIEHLLQLGFLPEDLGDLVVKDDYVSASMGVRHTYLRQRWQGIEVWNGDIAIHRHSDGTIVKLNNGAWNHMAKRVNTTSPVLTAEAALATVLAGNAPGVSMPPLVSTEDAGRLKIFDGSALGSEPVRVQLMLLAVGEQLRLVWNVNHYTTDGTHWWNVRIDAVTGDELDRNDWVSQCAFDEGHAECGPEEEASAPPPAAPNDYNVYPAPVESPSHGARALRNAPWTLAGIASPYGWHDTNGAAGPEYTYTRGNNVWAQEDANNNNGTGASPNSATLDFDYALNLGGAPSTYQNAAITNLYYWNNLMHDVWYQYGFDDPGGNFQSNNYGRGGLGADYVLADAQDGGGTNNANFGTPPDGASPRMQMYVWTYTAPSRDGDIDNCIIAHEYTHGISNRLVGGPSNTNCLTNAEQMGEGWSDWFALMMTIEPGDQGIDRRGIGTYVLGQGVTGTGIRPAPYSTSFAQNNYTYASTNNAGLAAPHGIGFVWCTILWEMTWDMIATYGFDPNLYTGTGGNNRAMRLVTEAMKLTPCNPGFVDARDAILLADQNIYGGANQTILWNAFARRGLGASASQGTNSSRFDQTEAYDTPMTTNVGVAQILTPASGTIPNCTGATITVSALIRNYGSVAQSNFPVRYQLDGGAWVSQNYAGPLGAGASATFTFTVPVTITAVGAHTLVVATVLPGDMFAGNDQSTSTVTVAAATNYPIPFTEGLSAASPTPTGWTLQNPDGLTTWSTTVLANGPGCASSRVWSIDMFAYSNVGQEDRLVTPKITLPVGAAAHLKFDHAHAPYGPGYYDGFRVDVSGNCGGNWTTVYAASGVALGTAAASTAAWAPTNCSQWQTHDINISAFDGQTIMVRFVSINGYGNFLYMDNVHVGSAISLPVELVDISAWPESDGIKLAWVTATENNSERYDIERSTNGENWIGIGTQAAAGNSFTRTEYNFLDGSPRVGPNYYRLQMIDIDGSRELSATVSAQWKTDVQLSYPNPSDGSFWVSASADEPVEVIDALGQSMPFTRAPAADGLVHIELLRPVSGLYLLRVGTGDGALVERIMLGER
ncbi:MAG: M36 family metallopeptidase [Flavobacteriales bacterium]